MPICEETTISPSLATSTSGLVVIKVGGSLLDWPELPGRLAAFLDNQRGRAACLREQAVLVAGGGPFADLIRTMDQTHDLGDQKAHRLAIRSLDLTGELLAGLLPGSAVVHRPEDLWACRNAGQVPILAPGLFLEEVDDRGPDPLPASWDVTSDSIAARIAVLLGARRLILLKSTAPTIEISRGEAAQAGLVDPMFPAIARQLEVVELVCLRDAEPQRRLLTADREGSETGRGRPGSRMAAPESVSLMAGAVSGIAVAHGKTRTRPSSSSRVMSQLKLISVDHPEIPALAISTRLRSQLVYFMTPPDTPGIPVLGESEYWLSRSEVTKWLSDGVLLLVSPLDTENMTEVELSEEQEVLLGWLDKHQVQHIRVVE
jgi:aspartokinase-like uncharacterized kinase